MKLLTSISTALIAIINAITSFFTMTIPNIGESTYKTVDMANKAIDKAHKEMLIESISELEKLYEDTGLSDEQIAEVERMSNAYKNNDWRASAS